MILHNRFHSILFSIEREGHHIRLWCDILTVGILRMIFLKIAIDGSHAFWFETRFLQFLWCHQTRVQPNTTRRISPTTGILEIWLTVVDIAVHEHIAPLRLGCTRSGNHITSGAISRAALCHDTTEIKERVTVTTDEIHRAMNLRAIEISLT